MLSEFYRIADHIVCIGTNLVDMGALTNFWYLFQPREEIIALAESCSGARLLPSYLRIGGLAVDVPSDFLANSQRIVNMLPTLHRRGRGAGDEEPHLPRPRRRRRRDLAGGRDQLRLHRPLPPRHRRALRRPQGHPLPRLRDLRLGRAGRRRRRHVRALPGALRGDAPVAAHPAAGHRPRPARRDR